MRLGKVISLGARLLGFGTGVSNCMSGLIAWTDGYVGKGKKNLCPKKLGIGGFPCAEIKIIVSKAFQMEQ